MAIKTLEKFGLADDAISINESYERLGGWVLEGLEFGDPKTTTERQRAKTNLKVLDQGLLHRADKLLLAAGLMIEHQNIYGLAQVTRGHLETAAQLGYFCDRLRALRLGNIGFEDFHERLALTLLGAGDPSFKHAPKPLNIMTCIDKADRYFQFKDGTKAGEPVIRWCYDWLSDYCHPNFLSSASSFTFDKPNNRVDFRHQEQFNEKDADLTRIMHPEQANVA